MIQDDQTFPAALPGAQSNQPPEPSIYEQMHRYLYDFYFGTMSFLELLDAFEEILGIHKPSDQDDVA